MYKNLVLWVESYFLHPNLLQKFISFLLLPFTLIYCIIVSYKRKFASPIDFQIPIISVGNLTVGGSGKTPLILSLAKRYKKPAIVLRGYKRDSHGLHVISDFKEIKTEIKTSGDEAMLYAKSLKNTLVIVSEDRKEGILKAKEFGANVVFLDDGFSKADIKKFDILIEPNPYPKNHFCIPSGGFREPESAKKYADIILHENKQFTRKTHITNETKKMILVTAIANASRLDKYLPHVEKKYIFPDHYAFKKDELQKLLDENDATSILTTRKDWVKMENFGLPLSFLELEIHINEKILQKIDTFVKNLK